MYCTIEEALTELANKQPVIIFDRDNENEGDLVVPSEIITTDVLTFMLNNCKGIICVTLEEKIINKLEIPLIAKKGNNVTGQTNFVVPIDHVNSDTGISSNDRKLIIDEILSENGNHINIVYPGHQNVLKIASKGLLERQGHTESSSELVHMAGYKKSATICEIIDSDGVPMREAAIGEFGKTHNIKVVLLSDIYNHYIKSSYIEPYVSIFKNPFNILNGKKVLLTGGSSGIGKALREKLITFDCKVDDLSRTNGIDVTDYHGVNTFIEKNIEKVDILINCAGFIQPCKIEKMQIEDWEKHISTNLTSVFNITKSTIPKFTDGGCILNISSPSADKTRDEWSAYCCTKAALNSFTLNCAEELFEKNIMVNAISPTKTDTPMIHTLFPDIKKDSLIPTEVISNYMINILCHSIVNKKTGVIYQVKNRF